MEEQELTLTDLLKVALKWWWLLIIGMVAAGACAFYYGKFCVTPMYKATTKCYVQASRQSVEQSSSDALIGEQRGIALSQMVVSNYIEILDTNNFAKEVAFYLGGNTRDGDSLDKLIKLKDIGTPDKRYTAKQLRKMITYTPKEELAVFSIDVVCDDASDAMKVERCIETVMMDYIESVAPGSGIISIIDNAYPSNGAINNRTVIYTLVGIIFGAAVMLGAAFIFDSADTRVKDEKSLSEACGLPVIGTIPDVFYAENQQRDDPIEVKNNGKARRS